MPRRARLDTPGTVSYVMVQGIEQGNIDRDDSDRDEFLCRYLPRHDLEAKTSGETDGTKTTAGTRTTGVLTRLPPGYAYPEGVSGYGTWNQSGNVMSGVASGTKKPIQQTPHPTKNPSARREVAAGVTPTSSPSAFRNARSWFPKPSTISADSDWYCRCWRGHKQLRTCNSELK